MARRADSSVSALFDTRYADYWRLWTVGLMVFVVRWLETWPIAVSCCVNGLGWAADNPVRRVMIGDSVGSNHMGATMLRDVGASNASRMTGPALAGFLLSYFGIEGVFALSVGLYALALAAA